MKKSKFLKRASIIALSAVMTAGVALGAAACGGGGGGGTGGTGGTGGSGSLNAEGYRSGTPGRGTDPNKLTVYIFCNESDAETNKQICNDWMAKYNAAHNTNYSVDFTANTDKADYFDKMGDYWSNNSMYDVIYIAPRYVRSYAETGSVLNLTDYLDKVAADPSLTGDAVKTANTLAFSNIWKNALSYYSYQKGKMDGADAYKLGQAVSFNATDYGFYTDAGNEKVGLYGLPKDYSSFATGYNRIFFSQGMKEAVTTTPANANRDVKGAANGTSGSVTVQRHYTLATGMNMNNGNGVVRYAVSGPYTNPYTGEPMTATEGDPAPIINVGVPTRYTPFNFYRFDTYADAVAGGDPMALMVEAFTGGEGYVVTIPGFPNDDVSIPSGVTTDANAPYDTTMGHITYTYAEYSALIWAMTYYINTFDGQPFLGSGLDSDGNPAVGTDGYGGTTIGKTVKAADGSGSQKDFKAKVVFGGEQYEGVDGAPGSVLYLLPWLYGNDADLIDSASLYCQSLKDGEAVDPKVAIAAAKDWRNYVGDDSEKVSKMNLDGTYREVDVQYGFDSQKFLETYGAFLALASDWNANNGGDTDTASDNNGWAYFRGGRSLFYGAGSWDAATRNDSEPTVLEFGQMPTPVSENYALYSKIKGANYTMEEYSNGATEKGTGASAGTNDAKQRDNLASGCKIYSADEILKNQILRQDKWGARMDSVGYAVNGQVTNYTGAHEWKEEAAVSLVMALTIERSAQVTLTVGGAQFPNFTDQMVQFVNYQDPQYADGAFKDMLTPEGFSNMQYYKDGKPDPAVAAEAKKIWDGYYALALEMQELARDKSTQTVGAFLAGKKVNGADVKYNEQFKDTQIGTFVGSSSGAYLANAMKVLNMVALWRSDREINLRMQYGLNAVRDSTMYTYADNWIGNVDARRSVGTMLAYRGQQLFVDANKKGLTVDAFKALIKQDPSNTASTYETPVVFALKMTATSQTQLADAITAERAALEKIKGSK